MRKNANNSFWVLAFYVFLSSVVCSLFWILYLTLNVVLKDHPNVPNSGRYEMDQTKWPTNRPTDHPRNIKPEPEYLWTKIKTFCNIITSRIINFCFKKTIMFKEIYIIKFTYRTFFFIYGWHLNFYFVQKILLKYSDFSKNVTCYIQRKLEISYFLYSL